MYMRICCSPADDPVGLSWRQQSALAALGRWQLEVAWHQQVPGCAQQQHRRAVLAWVHYHMPCLARQGSAFCLLQHNHAHGPLNSVHWCGVGCNCRVLTLALRCCCMSSLPQLMALLCKCGTVTARLHSYGLWTHCAGCTPMLHQISAWTCPIVQQTMEASCSCGHAMKVPTSCGTQTRCPLPSLTPRIRPSAQHSLVMVLCQMACAWMLPTTTRTPLPL